LNQNELFEDIDSAKENDEKDQDEQFVYNLSRELPVLYSFLPGLLPSWNSQEERRRTRS
jgi:hypothetical protein